MARRPFWRGRIRISLVSFPIGVYTATQRGATPVFHEMDRASGERVHRKNIVESGREVPDEEIVKGLEVGEDGYVYVEKEEIEALKLPSSSTLDLNLFVENRDLPPFYLEKPYFVLPEGDETPVVYRVIVEALRRSGRIGIGQIALRGREELCAVFPYRHGLLLETLRYAAEVKDIPAFFSEEPPGLSDEHLSLAQELIERNTGPFDIDAFHDHYHEALQELIAAKKEHRAPRPVKEEAPRAKIVDFTEALRQSLKESPQPRPPSKSRSGSA